MWSEGKPLSAGWANNGWTCGSTTNGRGSVWSAPATFTRTATTTIVTTAWTASTTFSRREQSSHTASAPAATT